MSLNAIFDIAIGLMTMYLVLSLICTSINEFISSVVALRAKGLRTALHKLIDEPTLRTAFNGHGLVVTTKGIKNSDPAYMSGTTFALALIDSLTPDNPVATFDDVKSAALALPRNWKIREVVLSNIALAGTSIAALRNNLATTFDQTMDRVSGTYTRRLKWLSLAVGIGLATALNADSIAVGRALWEDKPRTEMVKLAQEALSKGIDKDKSVLGNGTMSTDDIAKNYKTVVDHIDKATELLRPLPIGWQSSTVSSTQDIPLKVLGLLLTGIALMLGAPFWFDILSKFVRLRFTGEKPARTPASDP